MCGEVIRRPSSRMRFEPRRILDQRTPAGVSITVSLRASKSMGNYDAGAAAALWGRSDPSGAVAVPEQITSPRREPPRSRPLKPLPSNCHPLPIRWSDHSRRPGGTVIEDGQTPHRWITQTTLGAEFGWNSIEAGRCLSLIGLRKGNKPEQHALDAELAIVQTRIKQQTGEPYEQVFWHQTKVLALLTQFIDAHGGLDQATSHLRETPPDGGTRPPRQRPRQGKPADAVNKTDHPDASLRIAELEERVRSLEGEITDLKGLFANWAAK